MNLKALRAFCLVMRRGSLAAAAEDLHLSQPAVSRLVSNLEHELKLSLFHRDRRTLRPSAEARAFYREAARILAGIEQLPDIAGEIRAGSGSRLRVVVMSRLAQAVVAPAARRFTDGHPDIVLTLEMHHRRDMERWLAGRQFDLGFGPLPVEDASLDVEPLCTRSAVAVLPAASPLRSAAAARIADLATEPLIALTPDTLLQSQIDAMFSMAGLAPRIALRTSSSHLACALAAQGLGYTITDPFAARSFADAAAMVPVDPSFALDFGVLWPREAQRSRAAEAFCDCVRRQVASAP
ncbi:MAG: LysR family transcriptional regulator [Inquilinaceae bacterium]